MELQNKTGHADFGAVQVQNIPEPSAQDSNIGSGHLCAHKGVRKRQLRASQRQNLRLLVSGQDDGHVQISKTRDLILVGILCLGVFKRSLRGDKTSAGVCIVDIMLRANY